MSLKTVEFAILEGIQAEMRRDPLLSLNLQGEWPYAEGPEKRVIDLRREFGYPRVYEAGPLDEMWLGGSAIGMARYGVPTITHLPKMTTLYAMDMIFHQAGMLRYMSGGVASCPVVFWMISSRKKERSAGTHCFGGLEPMFAHMPGLKVVSPSNAYDAKGLMIAAIRDPDPVIFFDHEQVQRLKPAEVPDEPYVVPIGEAAIREEGTDITIVGHSNAALEIAKAIPLLKEEGISPEFIDFRSMKPLPIETIVKSVRKTGRLLTLDTVCYTFSPGAEIVAEVAEFLPGAKFRRLAFPDAPTPAARSMFDWCMPSAENTVAAVKKMM